MGTKLASLTVDTARNAQLLQNNIAQDGWHTRSCSSSNVDVKSTFPQNLFKTYAVYEKQIIQSLVFLQIQVQYVCTNNRQQN